MILSLLRRIMIDYALDTRDRDLFQRLTSPGWEQFVIGPEDTEEDVVTNYLVLCNRDTQKLITLPMSDVSRTTVFAVPQKEWDCSGWRDTYGLTFYDRLRTAGHRYKTVWVGADRSTWNEICRTHRVVHPKDLLVAHPSRRLYVHHTHASWESMP